MGRHRAHPGHHRTAEGRVLDIEKGNRLVYAFESPDGGGRLSKLVFRINYQEKGGITNSFRTAGYVDYHNLGQGEYLLLAGDLRL